MRILHVASFHGNIGDNANHAGFRPWFESLLARPVEWQEFEIRNVYRKTASFGDAFVELANAADLVVIGGGNYFELWVEHSPTGTSISIDEGHFAKIERPIFFNALGVDEGQGASEQAVSRFRTFLGRLLGSRQYLVSIRNDGAVATLEKFGAGLPVDRVLRLPDGGFFASYQARSPRARERGLTVAINLAGDMLDQRFPGGGSHDYESFLAEFAGAVDRLVSSGTASRVVLIPHIYSDVRVFADLLGKLPDAIRRERVRMAAYDAGDDAARAAFGEYLAADLVFAMRFHANVVPIAHGIPTFGLVCYGQIEKVYAELHLSDYAIDVRLKGFSDRILSEAGRVRGKDERAGRDLVAANNLVRGLRDDAARSVKAWLKSHDLAAA